MTTGFCKMRVWANGDMDSCIERTLPGNTYCIAHRISELNRMQRDIVVKETELRNLQEIYNHLLAEGIHP